MAIQVLGAAIGAVLAVGGVAIAASSWPRRDESEVRRLLVGVGFFGACVGGLAMVAGAGLYH